MPLKRVIFEFEDGGVLVLEEKSLSFWQFACDMKSDYLYPHQADDALGEGYGGLIRGFFSRKWAEEQLAKGKAKEVS